MDYNAIIVGILAVLGSYLGNVALSRKKSREDELKDKERETRQEDRMRSIEKKLDEHNSYGQKFYEVKSSIIEMKKDIEFIKEKIK